MGCGKRIQAHSAGVSAPPSQGRLPGWNMGKNVCRGEDRFRKTAFAERERAYSEIFAMDRFSAGGAWGLCGIYFSCIVASLGSLRDRVPGLHSDLHFRVSANIFLIFASPESLRDRAPSLRCKGAKTENDQL